MNELTATMIPLLKDNVDTDQIIPARFLKATSKTGFGENLFRDWRYKTDGSTINDFVLNKPEYQGEVLLTGENFGCGSSREHAAWAIGDYGFRVVIAKSFADIFRGNALNNGILPIEVSADFHAALVSAIKRDTAAQIKVDLANQLVVMPGIAQQESFEIPAYKKECLMKGLDDLDFLIGMREEIEEKLIAELL